MLCVGIDLSASKAATAAVSLAWDDGYGTDQGRPPVLGLDDAAVIAKLARADRAAIDAPFGWPDAFREQIEAWSATSAWPSVPRRSLRFRLTDEFCAEHGRLPLSVSSDRIASTAMRCAELLALQHNGKPIDRVTGDVIEAYPAGALVAWGIDAAGYKDPGATARRHDIADELARRGHLHLSAATFERCAATDHALDALVCALVARAAARDRTLMPAAGDADQVAREGWIHLPDPASLEYLSQ